MAKVEIEIEQDKEDEKYTDWRIDDAYSTLKRAEEIKQDPKMMEKIQGKLDKDKKAIRSLAQLKSKASEVMSEDEED
jgi:hypothetical protein